MIPFWIAGSRPAQRCGFDLERVGVLIFVPHGGEPSNETGNTGLAHFVEGRDYVVVVVSGSGNNGGGLSKNTTAPCPWAKSSPWLRTTTAAA